MGTATIEAPAIREVDLGGPVAYQEWPGPEDRTFVLVHGLGGSHRNWMLVAPRLAREGRVLVPDLPGFGITPLAGRSARLPALRALLSRFVRHVAGERAILAGNSMGGALAVLQAALEPASVRGLVLTCPVLPPTGRLYPAPLAVLAFSLYRMPGVGEFVIGQRFTRIDPERQVRLAFRILAGDPASIGPEVVRAHADLLREHLDDPEALRAFVDAARSIHALVTRPAAYRGLMARVRVPVLILHGRRDPLVPAGLAEATVEANPAWRLRVFPDLGHVVQLEAPDRWLAALDAWLQELEGAHA